MRRCRYVGSMGQCWSTIYEVNGVVSQDCYYHDKVARTMITPIDFEIEDMTDED